MEPTIADLMAHTDQGDPVAADALFTALYRELHRLARRELARRGRHLSLGATTLLHEAYLDISAGTAVFPDRPRFMGYASRVMRGLIVDYARRRRAQKRGGAFELVAIDTDVPDPTAAVLDLEELSAALDALAVIDARLAQVVDLKFFCGFTLVEIAAMRGVTERTAQRDWEKARAFLHETLRRSRLDD